MNSPLDWNSILYDVSLFIQEASSVLKWIIQFVLMLHYMDTQTTVHYLQLPALCYFTSHIFIPGPQTKVASGNDWSHQSHMVRLNLMSQNPINSKYLLYTSTVDISVNVSSLL